MYMEECRDTVVVMAQRGAVVIEASSLMREGQGGALVVLDPDGDSLTPVGIDTDRNRGGSSGQEFSTSEALVVNIMHSSIVPAGLDSDLLDAPNRMRCEASAERRWSTYSAFVCFVQVDGALDLPADAIGRVPSHPVPARQ